MSLMICMQPGCPVLVDVPGCWCFEHLSVCSEVDCNHPAHDCQEPVHFCERHAATPEEE